MNPTIQKHRRVVWSMALLLLVCTLGSFALGRYPVSIREVLGILWHKLAGLFGTETPVFWTE